MERTKEIKRRELVFDQKPIRSNPEWKARTESRTCVKKKYNTTFSIKSKSIGNTKRNSPKIKRKVSIE